MSKANSGGKRGASGGGAKAKKARADVCTSATTWFAKQRPDAFTKHFLDFQPIFDVKAKLHKGVWASSEEEFVKCCKVIAGVISALEAVKTDKEERKFTDFDIRIKLGSIPLPRFTMIARDGDSAAALGRISKAAGESLVFKNATDECIFLERSDGLAGESSCAAIMLRGVEWSPDGDDLEGARHAKIFGGASVVGCSFRFNVDPYKVCASAPSRPTIFCVLTKKIRATHRSARCPARTTPA